MSKILILGHGNLGQALARVYADQKPIVWDKAELDITNANEARQKITALKPNLIFNAAALTDTKAAETTLRAEALAVNATAVGNLAQIAKNLGATFVHFSTDYVFDGRKKEGYTEIDIPKNPLNYYGFTKLEGERLMLRAYGLTHESIKYKVSSIKYPFYLVRTSWLFAKGTGFPFKILELAKKQNEIKIINDQHGKPTYAPDLAAATRALIDDQAPSGIYHLTNEPAMTWYDLAKLTLEIAISAGSDLAPTARSDPAVLNVLPVKTGAFPDPVKRPEWSVLHNAKRPPLRHIRDALAECVGN